MRSRGAVVVALAAGSFCLACGGPPELLARQPAPVDTFRLVNTYPHDPTAYTQGLIYRDGFLFESTGLTGQSTLRKVRLETGEVVQEHRLDRTYFAEGLAESNGQLVQLTWRSGMAFVYDLASFAPQGTFKYAGEGWGLTRDREGFILSDGSEHLRFLRPDTFEEIRRLTVTDGGVPVRELNELEFIRGEVYANVWHSDRIARISPQSGRVVRWIDLRDLLPAHERPDPEAVLNGIAYDEANNRLFVTGKLWPRLFEIEIVAQGERVDPAEPVRAGLVVTASGQSTLAMEGPVLAPDEVLTLVTIDSPQQVHRVVVTALVSESEPMARSGTPRPYYSLTPESGSGTLPSLAVAVLGRPDIVRLGTAVSLRIDAPAVTVRVRGCTSTEGLHLTLWDDEPLKSNRLWHAYHYLGYDVVATCQPGDYRDGATKPALVPVGRLGCG